jgi:hypothetical protein
MYFTWADGSVEGVEEGAPELWVCPPGWEPDPDCWPEGAPGLGCDPFCVLVVPLEGADVVLPPAADVLPPELREAQPASATSTTAVLATVLTRSFIVLHLLAVTTSGTWTRPPSRRFP